MRILVVEDEPKIATSIAECLQGEDCEVLQAGTVVEAKQVLGDEPLGLVILDLKLPDGHGFSVLRYMRNRSLRTPVLILTANDATGDKVQGLDMGADDYLVKPFAMSELLARVRALSRRASDPRTQYAVGDLEVDLLQRTVRREKSDIELTQKEFELLKLLAQHAGHAVSREMVANAVWKDVPRATPLDNVIDVHIARLRRKIDGPYSKKLLRTRRGIGFLLTDAE
jgi:two-component system copper resistance phosphate regulon response regulator CusR